MKKNWLFVIPLLAALVIGIVISSEDRDLPEDRLQTSIEKQPNSTSLDEGKKVSLRASQRSASEWRGRNTERAIARDEASAQEESANQTHHENDLTEVVSNEAEFELAQRDPEILALERELDQIKSDLRSQSKEVLQAAVRDPDSQFSQVLIQIQNRYDETSQR